MACLPRATRQAANVGKSPVPLKFLGRFAHEAVAVDPATSVIYETEDAAGPNGLYFRWLPPAGFTGGKDALRTLALSPGGDTAGRLQAMSCYLGSRHIPDLSLATLPGTRYRVRWVDVPDRDAATVSVRSQFTEDQITRSRKLEGAWWGDGGAYFVASFARNSDGSVNEHDGQVWFYDPATESVTLKTIFGVNLDPDADTDNYDGPDNITVSPYGGVILAEDGEGIQHLVGVTDQGKSYPIAATTSTTASSPGRRSAPMAGSCSSTSSRRVMSSRSPDRGAAPATLMTSNPSWTEYWTAATSAGVKYH
jgi:secreted PhoX family phosphatase